MFSNWFTRKKSIKNKLSEPVFPKEQFEVSEISDKEGFVGISNINKSYDNYPNKKFFPWWVQVTFELKEVLESGLPTEREANILDELENKIETFIKNNHTTHFIGRVTSNGFRDLIYYVDRPNFNQEETQAFFDGIQEIRHLNFTMEEDNNWNNVSGFIN